MIDDLHQRAAGADAAAAALQLLTQEVQRFILLTHHGNYGEAARVACLFADHETCAAALHDRPADRLHLLFCQGVLALHGLPDRPAAELWFARLLQEAQRCAAAPATSGLGAEFLILAEQGLAQARQQEPAPAAGVRLAAPAPIPARLGIGVITYNRHRQLEDALARIFALTTTPFELVVADDGSTDETMASLRSRNIPVVSGPNRGIAWNKNRALFYLLAERRCDVIILLEDDAHPTAAGWERPWAEAARRWGHVNLFSPLHRRYLRGGRGTAAVPALLAAVTAQCAAFSSAALHHVGFMDTRFGTYGLEHCEHTGRMLRAGYGGVEQDGEPRYFGITGAIAMGPSASYFTAERVRQNLAVFQQISGEPLFRQAWRNDDEMRQFRAEIAAAAGRPAVPFDPRTAPPGQPCPATAAADPANYLGAVSTHSTAHVAGWVFNRKLPGQPVACEAVVKGAAGTPDRRVASFLADRAAPEIATLALSEGHCGFHVEFDVPLAPAEHARLVVWPAACRYPIDGCPFPSCEP